MNKFVKKSSVHHGIIILGSAIFAVGTNLFVVPINLYSGGVLGFLQVVRTLLVEGLMLELPNGFDIVGIMNFIFNIPLLLIAYKFMSRSFFISTSVSLITITLVFTLTPIPSTLLIDDAFASCVLGGVVTGFGIGLVLQASGSSGGIDIIGVILSKKNKNFSVGRLALIFNTVLYLICAIVFDVQTALYSILYIAVFSVVVDRFHLQNIAVSAMVFTKKQGVDTPVLNDLVRGVTKWNGVGAYTDESLHVFIAIISKYEIDEFRELVQS